MLGEIFSNILLYSVPPTAAVAGYLLYKVGQIQHSTACEVIELKEQIASLDEVIQHLENQYAVKLEENARLREKWIRLLLGV